MIWHRADDLGTATGPTAIQWYSASGTADTPRASAACPHLPSRPGEFHPEPLTGPDLSLSTHPARATARRLPPSVERRALVPRWATISVQPGPNTDLQSQATELPPNPWSPRQELPPKSALPISAPCRPANGSATSSCRVFERPEVVELSVMIRRLKSNACVPPIIGLMVRVAPNVSFPCSVGPKQIAGRTTMTKFSEGEG